MGGVREKSVLLKELQPKDCENFIKLKTKGTILASTNTLSSGRADHWTEKLRKKDFQNIRGFDPNFYSFPFFTISKLRLLTESRVFLDGLLAQSISFCNLMIVRLGYHSFVLVLWLGLLPNRELKFSCFKH